MQRNESDIIWASGHFLTENLPDDYDQWSDEKLDDFIDDHIWEPFEDLEPSFIWDQILNRNLVHDLKLLKDYLYHIQ